MKVLTHRLNHVDLISEALRAGDRIAALGQLFVEVRQRAPLSTLLGAVVVEEQKALGGIGAAAIHLVNKVTSAMLAANVLDHRSLGGRRIGHRVWNKHVGLHGKKDERKFIELTS